MYSILKTTYSFGVAGLSKIDHDPFASRVLTLKECRRWFELILGSKTIEKGYIVLSKSDKTIVFGFRGLIICVEVIKSKKK